MTSPPATVLVVEDDPSACQVMVAILEDAGYEVLAADNGTVGLQLVRERDVSLVLLDSSLPGLDGHQVLTELRRDPATMTLPVIIVSGRDGEDDRVAGLGLGANDYVVKPFNARELVARVEAHLRLHETWSQAWSADWQLRSEVARQLLRLSPQAPVGVAASAVCRELGRLAGVGGVAVIRLDENEATVLAQDGFGVSTSVARPLEPGGEQYLRAHVAAGPWPAPPDGPPVFGPAVARAARDTRVAFAPLEAEGEVFGVLAVAAPLGTAGGRGAVTRCLTLAADLAPVASTVLRPAAVDPWAGSDWLQQLIDDQRFRPVFQPVIDLRDRSVVGYEALTRFDGDPPPQQVFDLARHLGLEADLEFATLAAAVEASQRLPDGAYVSLNVSPSVVMHTDALAGVLGRARPPVVIEITERVPVDDYIGLTDALAGLGPHVRVAVDDAGSGYASLSHVLALRPSIIKLDRVLIEGLGSDAGRRSLLLSLGRFADDVSATLVAEGIETDDELAAVQGCGVSFAQGFLLGRPAPL